jgi:hypothetical protein
VNQDVPPGDGIVGKPPGEKGRTSEQRGKEVGKRPGGPLNRAVVVEDFGSNNTRFMMIVEIVQDGLEKIAPNIGVGIQEDHIGGRALFHCIIDRFGKAHIVAVLTKLNLRKCRSHPICMIRRSVILHIDLSRAVTE